MDCSNIFKDVEPDMAVYPAQSACGESDIDASDTDIYIHNIFLTRPLLGSEIIPDDVLGEIERSTAIFLHNLVDGGCSTNWYKNNLSRVNAEKVTLALINHTKKKDSKDVGFWEYISVQYGYTEQSAVVKIKTFFYNAMQEAMEQSGRERYFIITSRRQYSQTVSLHAFVPKKSWFSVLDLLYRVYMNDLGGTIDRENPFKDPILDLMMDKLYQRFCNDLGGGEDDDDESDESEAGEAQEGIGAYRFSKSLRHLICEKKMYSRSLLASMIFRIEELVTTNDLAVESFEDRLCVEWWKNRHLAEKSVDVRERRSRLGSVAYRYEDISVQFALSDKLDCLKIVVPNVRLKESDYKEIRLKMFYGERIVYDELMPFDGVLFKTMYGMEEELPEFDPEMEMLKVRVTIDGDGEKIYDSKEELYREFLLFPGCGGGEVSVKKDGVLDCGDYIFVASENLEIKGNDKVNMQTVYSFRRKPMRARYIELSKDFALYLNGEAAISDKAENGARLVCPSYSDCPARYVKSGTTYRIVPDGACRIFAADDAAKGCVIVKNGKRTPLEGLERESDEDRAYILPIENSCTVMCFNEQNRKKEAYFAATDLKVTFNRDFYWLDEDYEDARCSLEFSGFSDSKSFSPSDDEVSIPYDGGEFVVSIPRVEIKEEPGEALLGGAAAAYLKNIPQDCRLIVKAPKNVSVTAIVDGTEYTQRGGVISVGNAVRAHQSRGVEGNFFGVELKIYADRFENGEREEFIREYRLKKIYCNDVFLTPPEISFDIGERLLCLNGMENFVGGDDAKFVVTLSDELDRQHRQHQYTFDLVTSRVALRDDTPLDAYRYTVDIKTASDFAEMSTRASSGHVIVGDEDELRFRGRKLEVEPVLCKVDREKYDNPTISKYLIREIEYKGIEDTQDGVCPVYSGILYVETNNGRGQRDFSKSDKPGKKENENLYKFNPVQLIYLDDEHMDILTNDGDGIQCKASGIKNNYTVELTDVEYNYYADRNVRDFLFFAKFFKYKKL